MIIPNGVYYSSQVQSLTRAATFGWGRATGKGYDGYRWGRAKIRDTPVSNFGTFYTTLPGSRFRIVTTVSVIKRRHAREVSVRSHVVVVGSVGVETSFARKTTHVGRYVKRTDRTRLGDTLCLFWPLRFRDRIVRETAAWTAAALRPSP